MSFLVLCSGAMEEEVEVGQREGIHEGGQDKGRVGLPCLMMLEGEQDSDLARESTMKGQHGSLVGKSSAVLFRE